MAAQADVAPQSGASDLFPAFPAWKSYFPSVEDPNDGTNETKRVSLLQNTSVF
jgi:hypothetical protein